MNDITKLYSRFNESTGITTDTRQCREGMMFVALRGENFDGNRYAKSALEQGCRYAVVDNAAYADPADEFPLLYSNVYNNYAKTENKRKGFCCVYRLQRAGESFVTTLVQLIEIGFTEEGVIAETSRCLRCDHFGYGNFKGGRIEKW